MPPNAYTILRRIEPPEKCYLSEVLLWRAFGRFPEMHYDSSGNDWRFESEALDGHMAPIPDGFELTGEECRYAGLPDDPTMIALVEQGGFMEIKQYDDFLNSEVNLQYLEKEKMEELKAERKLAVKHKAELEKWSVLYTEYIDQFQAEICLKLRRGELSAMATKLPHADPETADKILEERGSWLTDFDRIDVEKERWIFQTVDWDDSAIYGQSESFIWVHVRTEDMLKVFPPQDLLKPEHILPIGNSFALAGSAIRKVQYAQSQRGRPSLPWQDFHIEVARMFRDGNMPIKKEAAIALIQEWFAKTHKKNVSRAAIGERLKPYFDELIKNGQ